MQTHPSIRSGSKGLGVVRLRAVVKMNTDEIQNSVRRLLGLVLAAKRGKTGCGRGSGPLYGSVARDLAKNPEIGGLFPNR